MKCACLFYSIKAHSPTVCKSGFKIFENEQFGSIRTVELDGTPYFVGKDVAEVLGYSNPQKAIRDHVDDEDRTVNESFTVNGTAITLINESGLYSLILSSKLPKAKEFKVTGKGQQYFINLFLAKAADT